MRVLILGTIVNNQVGGGIGVFDENLYEGFKKLGDEVNILSVGKSTKIDNIVAGNPTNNINTIYFRFRKIAKLIKEYKPDLVISSVQYCIGIKKYKRFWKKCTYVQVLHGIGWPVNGRIKTWAINKVSKFGRKHFDKVATVSYVSYALNQQLIGVKCDKVIHNGCNYPFKTNSERKYDAIYVGRFHPDKNVEMITDAFIELKKKNPNYKFAIVGYGEQEELFTKGKYKNAPIDFLGKKSPDEVKKIFTESKFFVSMFTFEPFGLTLCEALLSGCNVITQLSSGSAPLFFNKPYYHIANCVNKNELCDIIENAFSNYHEISEEEIKELAEYLDYKRVAAEYKELVDEK